MIKEEISQVESATCIGVDAFPVIIEVDDSLSLPKIVVVGLPDQSIKESRDRIKSAIQNCGFELPSKQYTINLAPADLKKEGPRFDLPITLGLLAQAGLLKIEKLAQYVFVGELSLNGQLRPVQGCLSIAMSLKNKNKTLILPIQNHEEATLQEDVKVLGFERLDQIVSFLNEDEDVQYVPKKKSSIPKIKRKLEVDLADIKGQFIAKRALEISVSGNHNLLMLGPPGSGKSLLAKSIPSILPQTTHEELLEIVKIYSVKNLAFSLVDQRPFRSPHHTISPAAMVGSGTNPQPGEISLAHHGVLFLDEFPEFPRMVLETMRGPLEDRVVTIARSKMSISFPASFMLVAAMNPCPCGYLTDREKVCKCTDRDIRRYRSKISGPILDRIDIQIEVPRIKYDDLKSKKKSDTSAVVRNRIEQVRQKQKERYQAFGFLTNAELPSKLLDRFCVLEKDAEKLLDDAMNDSLFSARGYTRILKMSRTIADMDNRDVIQSHHIMEAIQYRSLDRD